MLLACPMRDRIESRHQVETRVAKHRVPDPPDEPWIAFAMVEPTQDDRH